MQPLLGHNFHRLDDLWLNNNSNANNVTPKSIFFFFFLIIERGLNVNIGNKYDRVIIAPISLYLYCPIDILFPISMVKSFDLHYYRRNPSIETLKTIQIVNPIPFIHCLYKVKKFFFTKYFMVPYICRDEEGVVCLNEKTF